MAFVFDYGLVGLWCGILTGVVVTGEQRPPCHNFACSSCMVTPAHYLVESHPLTMRPARTDARLLHEDGMQMHISCRITWGSTN